MYLFLSATRDVDPLQFTLSLNSGEQRTANNKKVFYKTYCRLHKYCIDIISILKTSYVITYLLIKFILYTQSVLSKSHKLTHIP